MIERLKSVFALEMKAFYLGFILLLSSLYFVGTLFLKPEQMFVAFLLFMASIGLWLSVLTYKKIVFALSALLITFGITGVFLNNPKVFHLTMIEGIDIVLIGIALLVRYSKRSFFLVTFQSIVILLLTQSFISVMSYLFDVGIQQTWARYIDMDVGIAFVFLLISIGFLSCFPGRHGLTTIFFDTHPERAFFKNIPLFVLLFSTIIATIANKGHELGFYDDNFGDVLTLVFTLYIILALFWFNDNLLKKEKIKLKIVQSKLDSSEILFRQFTENTEECFWKASYDFKTFSYVSPAFFKIWGEQPEMLFKNAEIWTNSILEEDRKGFYETLQSMQHNGSESVILRYRILRKDGNISYIKNRVYLVNSLSDAEPFLLGIAEDITENYLAKQRIGTQHAISQLIAKGEEPHTIIPEFIHTICKNLDWDYGEFLKVNVSDQSLERSYFLEYKTLPMDIRDVLNKKQAFLEGKSFPEKVIQKGRVIYKAYEENGYANEEDFSKNIKTIIGIPIFYKEKKIGIFIFLSSIPKKLENDTLTMLEMMGLHLGEYLAHYDTEANIHQMSEKDLLTGLKNRHSIEENLRELIQNKHFQAVIIFSIDRFNLINQELGYDGGDLILGAIAKILSEHFSQNSNIGRLESDRFVLLPLEVENLNQVVNFTMSVFGIMKEVFFIKDKEMVLTTSVGISLFPKNGTSPQDLLKNAEIAMLESRKQGGNQFQLFTENFAVSLSEQLVLETELRRALTNDEFVLHYQPKVSLKTGEIRSVESLIRWNHPTKGFLQPGSFMPTAEDCGLIVPITEWIIREVFNLISEKKINICVAINVSAHHFREQYDLCSYLKQMLQGFHISASKIDLEITETALLNDTQYILSVLAKLKGLGFTLTLDDFGTKYSSLAYLKNIAADKIKIDKQFIDHIVENPEDEMILKGMLALFHTLGKKVVAEGVENEAQLRILMSAQCEEIQGYYFSKPLSLDDLNALLEREKYFSLPKI